MINQKYYNDIKAFPKQFSKGFEIAQSLSVSGSFSRVVVCGMGGSSLYVELINDFLTSEGEASVVAAARGYKLPIGDQSKTLFIVASYSGNTEETLACLDEIQAKGYTYIVMTTGGKLLAAAQEAAVPTFIIPGGIQPRLSTGYFISGIVSVLYKIGLAKDHKETLINASEKLAGGLNEDTAKYIAYQLRNRVPILYATEENSSIARICKIKFNENSKIQAFWNFFPELNHNEMVGFSKMVMEPSFIVFESQFTNERNKKRIATFWHLMQKQNQPVEIIEMQGGSILEEMLHAYYLIDHVTYYLAESYGIDPEPVDMVEEFKELLTR